WIPSDHLDILRDSSLVAERDPIQVVERLLLHTRDGFEAIYYDSSDTLAPPPPRRVRGDLLRLAADARPEAGPRQQRRPRRRGLLGPGLRARPAGLHPAHREGRRRQVGRGGGAGRG